MHKQFKQLLKWSSRKRVLLFVLFFALVLRGIALYFFLGQNNSLEKQFAAQLEQIEARDVFQKLTQNINTAILAIRGYTGSGDEKFLNDFSGAMNSVPALQKRFLELVKTAPDDEDRATLLKFSEWINRIYAAAQKEKLLNGPGKPAETRGFIAFIAATEPAGNLINESFRILSERIEKFQTVLQKTNHSGSWMAFLSFGSGLLMMLAVLFILLSEIGDREKVNEELRMQKQYLRVTFNSIGEGLITTGKDGRIQLMNTAAEKLTGWNVSEAKLLPLENVYNVLNEESGRPFENIVTRILKSGKPVSLENNTILRTKKQEELIISNSASPLFDLHGNISGTVLLFSDISEKKAVELKLKESEKNYKELFEQAADGIFLFDHEGNFISANTSGCMMLGYDKNELLKLNLMNVTPEKFQGKRPVNFSKLNDEKAGLFERQYMRKEGAVFCAEVSVKVLASGNIQAIIRDITDRKKASEIMRQANERYDILAQATSDTIWDWDIVNNRMRYNKGITNMFGYEISEVENLMDWWKKNIHPDDLPVVSESLDDLFKKKLQNIQLEYRFCCEDGTYKDVYDRAFVIFDEQGNPSRMIGAMQDVTFQKEEEKRIAKAMIQAQENERQQISLELHDNVNQILIGALLSLGMTKQAPGETIPGFVEKGRMYIKDAIEEIRKLSHKLAPASFEEVSLKEIFETLVQGVNAGNQFKIKLGFDEFDQAGIDDDIQINLYRIMQEQLNNIVKYASATEIDICLVLSNGFVKMTITDNGDGFDPKTVRRGIGLNNIKKRAESFGGKFMLNTAKGKGCAITVEIPLHKIKEMPEPEIVQLNGS